MDGKDCALGLGENAPVVLQVLPRLVTGGVERGTIDVAAALKEAGFTALVASEGGPMALELNRLGIEHVALPLASKNPLTLRRNASRLVELIRSRKVSLIHARSRAPAWSAYWAARRTGIPLVTTFHGTYGLGPLQMKHVYNRVMTFGDRVIAISDFIREHMISHYGVKEEKIRLIYRGVDLNRFDPAQVKAERMILLTRRWRLHDGEPVILMPGRLTRWKGQKVLLEALALIAELPFRCVLLGSDQGRKRYRAELESAIVALGLQGRVALADDCKDMPAAYMTSDVVVSASTDPEAFGRVVAEALAMGRPVVAPNHGAAPEIVRDGESGWLFAPNDAPSLAKALRAALSLTPQERAAYAGKSIAAVRSLFSKEKMCAETLALYRELLPR